MRATVSAKSLKSAVSWVSKVVKSRSSLPILECILLSAEDGRITVKATDLEVMLSRSVNATVMEATPVCVNAKSLRDYLSKIKGKNATVSIESKPILLVVLEANGITVTLPDGNPENYPLAPHDIEWANAISLDPNAISLKQVAKFADHEQDNGRLVLKCVLVEVYDEGQYRLTTADGFRLVTTNAIQGEPTASYLLPARAAEMMASLKTSGVLRFGSQKYENGPTLDYAQFTTDDSTIVSRLEDGKFPDYEQIIPASDRGTWATFDTVALAEKLQGLAAVADKHTYLTRLELSKSRAMLSASDSDGNEASTELPVDWTGEESFIIAFNAKYLLDCLALCGEQTGMMLDTPSRPLLIEGTGCQMIVMPMHIKG